VGNEYTFIDEYVNTRTKLTVKHNVCGMSYMVSPNSFLSHHNRCPYCHGNIAKHKSNSEFCKEVHNLTGDEYTFLDTYINRSTPIRVRHNICGKVYKVSPGNFLLGSRCISCRYKEKRLSISEAMLKVREAIGDSYEIINYPNSVIKPTTVRHKTCGNTFTARLSDIYYKHSGCPYCVSSIGEQHICDFLNRNNYHYEFQKRFDNLCDEKPLSYDFYIPSLGVLIEYQGEQHFKPKNFGGCSKQEANFRLELQKKHDLMKRVYAINHGYTLICPDYTMSTKSSIDSYLERNL